MSRVQWEMPPLEAQGVMTDVGILSEDIVRASSQYRNIHLACAAVSFLLGKTKTVNISLKDALTWVKRMPLFVVMHIENLVNHDSWV